MTVLSGQNDAARALYKKLLEGLPIRDELPLIVVVQHLVPNTLPLFQALADTFDVAAIIPKPNSIDTAALALLEQRSDLYKIRPTTRRQLKECTDVCAKLRIAAGERKLIVLDVGGYFEPTIANDPTFAKRLTGIVEDTENGHARYAKLVKAKSRPAVPIFSVARSPLKEPEDFLVGQSIVHSAERIIREDNSLLLNKRVLVIGYGKIGKSIASSLSARNIAVSVFDSDPIRRAQALSHGYFVPSRDDGIRSADLIFGATGKQSLSAEDLPNLKQHCYVASVTSADDEFAFGDALKDLAKTGVAHLSAYHNGEKTIYFLANGDAVNFAHRNSLGPYIYLVACEIVACIRRIIEGGTQTSGIQELSVDERRIVANLWLSAFGDP